MTRFWQCSDLSTSELLIFMVTTEFFKYYLQPGDYKTDDEAELMEENFGNEGEDDEL